jgi:hypothetical protein
MPNPALAQAIRQLIRVISETVNKPAVRAEHFVQGEGIHQALMLTLGQHMDARRPDSEVLQRAEEAGPLARLSIALWSVHDALESQEKTEAVEYANELFRELRECRLYSREREPTLGRDEARLRPVDQSLVHDLVIAAYKLLGAPLPIKQPGKGTLFRLWITFISSPESLEPDREWHQIKHWSCELFRHQTFSRDTWDRMIDWLRTEHKEGNELWETASSTVASLLEAAVKSRRGQVAPNAVSNPDRKPSSPEGALTSSGPLVQVTRWSELGIAIDSEWRFLAFVPCPALGAGVSISTGIALELPGERWRQVLELLASSKDGRTAKTSDLVQRLGYLAIGRQVISDEQAQYDDRLLERVKKAEKTLRSTMADLGRELRGLVSSTEVVFSCSGDFYLAAFTAGFLLRDENRRHTFRCGPCAG